MTTKVAGIDRPMSRNEMLRYIASMRAEDPVYWDAMQAMMERDFKRPDDSRYKTWLKEQSYLDIAFLGTGVLNDEWAWRLTDSYVAETHNGAECYPVIYGVYGPISSSTPKMMENIRKGHLLLGFVTHKVTGKRLGEHAEPELQVDEAFVLPCWDKREVEPMLRGCFLL
jgi:hypothetical protein